MLEPVLLSLLLPFLSLSLSFSLQHSHSLQSNKSEENSTFCNGGRFFFFFFFYFHVGLLFLPSAAVHSPTSNHGHHHSADLSPQVSTQTNTLFQCQKLLFYVFCVGLVQLQLHCVDFETETVFLITFSPPKETSCDLGCNSFICTLWVLFLSNVRSLM